MFVPICVGPIVSDGNDWFIFITNSNDVDDCDKCDKDDPEPQKSGLKVSQSDWASNRILKHIIRHRFV